MTFGPSGAALFTSELAASPNTKITCALPCLEGLSVVQRQLALLPLVGCHLALVDTVRKAVDTVDAVLTPSTTCSRLSSRRCAAQTITKPWPSLSSRSTKCLA